MEIIKEYTHDKSKNVQMLGLLCFLLATKIP